MKMARSWLKWLPLFMITSLGLFLELSVIRWIAGEVRLFSYFKNLPLLAAFLGLSVGYALVNGERDYKHLFAPLLGLLVALTFAVGRVISPRALTYPGTGDEYLWFPTYFSYWLDLSLFLGIVLVFFVSTMFLFIPLGQAAGEEMARHAPVQAYIVNLLASLAGVWLFALLSYLQTPPALWFGLALLGIGSYLATRQTLSRWTTAIFGLVLVAMLLLGQGVAWSPYHQLKVIELSMPRQSDGHPVAIGYTLRVQQVFYQVAMDLSADFLTGLNGEIPSMENAAFSYNLPYRLGPQGGRVLTVGAGMGNDVAAALRSGAGHVDAVEIDPTILSFGRRLHPEHPYDDPRVTPIVDDARSFFERSKDRYDVIAFGLLDSHTLLSGLSSVRLDSFVYTIESFEQVRGHLTEDGLAVVTFAAIDSAPWIEERLGRMMVEVFGPDRVFFYKGGVGTTFVAGRLSPEQTAEGHLVAWNPDPELEDLPLTTDNWPYLYLQTHRIPAAYWQALLLIGVACLILFARSFPQTLRPDWHFWLLGAAFLLVEFKSVTEFALLFGTTWLVNALAISGVLSMSLLANLVVLWRKSINLAWVYALLFGSLAITFLLPLDLLAGLPPVARAIGSMVLLSLPLFFAGLIFGESLRRTGETSRPLASNLSGSFAGGVLEYGSLLWGIKSLYLIAAAVYLVALATFWTRRK